MFENKPKKARKKKEMGVRKRGGGRRETKWGRPNVPTQKWDTTPVCEGGIPRRGFASNTRPTAPTNRCENDTYGADRLREKASRKRAKLARGTGVLATYVHEESLPKQRKFYNKCHNS